MSEAILCFRKEQGFASAMAKLLFLAFAHGLIPGEDDPEASDFVCDLAPLQPVEPGLSPAF